jgi:hypothetical protein
MQSPTKVAHWPAYLSSFIFSLFRQRSNNQSPALFWTEKSMKKMAFMFARMGIEV